MSGLPRIHALIPAAGRSVRFGGTTLKQYAHLVGVPVISHSIEAVSRHPAIRSVTVALASDDGIFEELVKPHWPDVQTVHGGDSRARTVMNGLQAILDRDPSCEWVLVHDAARPCLSRSDLASLVEQGTADPRGAILATPVSDTIKRADDNNNIERTVDRSKLWAAQTPQLFRIVDLAANLQAALDEGIVPTDEAAAMERCGVHPRLVEGCSTNIKITGAGDLALAEFVLQQQAVKDPA